MKRMAWALSVLALAAVPLSVADDCARWRAAFARMPSGAITIVVGNRHVPLKVKVPSDQEQFAAGFQCATRAEIERTNILFDFGHEIAVPFHMQNVAAPLDIAFAKTDGTIFSIQRMKPFR